MVCRFLPLDAPFRQCGAVLESITLAVLLDSRGLLAVIEHRGVSENGTGA